jgi:uncharacterized protein (DUF1810 family)
MMTTFDIERFKSAQETDFEYAMDELRAGRKRGHWIWYIFPQLEGLGMSPTARHYGIRGVEEAVAYLQDMLLRARLLEATAIVVSQRSRPLAWLMGSEIDLLKLVSSMTLFEHVARQQGDIELADAAGSVLNPAAEQGYSPCTYTLDQLGVAST